jgi:hypothetical protein
MKDGKERWLEATYDRDEKIHSDRQTRLATAHGLIQVNSMPRSG